MRTRLFAAVTLPALIGGAYASLRMVFEPVSFIIILAGLIAAELSVLFLSDYNYFKSGANSNIYPLLPGSPVISEKSLPTGKLPAAALGAGVIAAGVLIYFFIKVGSSILVFGGAAIIIALLQIFRPSHFSFIINFFLPPAVSGGVYMAMAGIYMPWAFLAPLPLSWLALTVSISHGRLYRGGYLRQGAANVIIVLYLIAFLNINLFYYAGIYSYYSLFISLLILLSVFHLLSIFRSEKHDCVPAVSIAEMVYFAVGLVLAVTVMF